MLDQIKNVWDWVKDLLDRTVVSLWMHYERLFDSAEPTGTTGGKMMVATFVVVILLFLLPLILLRGRRSGTALGSLTRSPRLLGYTAALILLALFGGWASIAQLSSAAIAPGVVSPDGHRKTIQHLEGGIIQAIHVHEGDIVEAGDVLVMLEDTQARAQYRQLSERYAHLLAQEARLQAERADSDVIAFPPKLAAMIDVDAPRIMEGETMLLQSRRAAQRGQQQILTQRIKQLDEENAGLRGVIVAENQQLRLIEQEVKGVQTLVDKGLERLPRLLALRRAQAQIEGEKASNRANIARNGQKIGETRMQLLTLREQQAEKVNEDLTKVSTGLAELRSQMASREDVLDRTAIRAPISGVVMNLRVTTQTGVISPGQPILDIVPTQAKLIIDAEVKPTDIDNVHPGMKARVLLTAYRQRTLPQIHGVLRSVSADRMVDDKSGKAYFLAKVEVDPEDLARLDGVRLMPGMPADVMILNGERTLFEYMLRPLKDSFTRSFRES